MVRAGFWGSRERVSPEQGGSLQRIPSRQGPGRKRLSVTQFPGPSRRKVEGAGHFSALPPTLGIPQLWAPGGLWRPGSWEPVGAGGEQLTQGGWVAGAKPALAGPVGQLRWAQSPHPAPPGDLQRPRRQPAPSSRSTLGGG